MAKQLIKQIRPHVALYRDEKTGLAWVEDGTTGTTASAHPNISATGSKRGMIDKGWWSKSDRTIRVRGFIYNIDHSVLSDMSDDLTRIAAEHCQCGGVH